MTDTRTLKIDIAPGDVVIDCGANVGIVTDYFQSKGATVYAFEPNPYAYKILKQRFANNPNVFCLQKGVSSPAVSGVGKLFLHHRANEDQVHWSTGSSMNPDKQNVDTSNSVDIDVIDLCKFIEDLGVPIKVLKIDIEGMEVELLDAFIENDLYTVVEQTYVETHEKKIPSLHRPLELVREKIREKGITNIDLTWR